MRLAWLSDIHLNFVEPSTLWKFLRTIQADKLDGVIVSGDIGEAPSVCNYLVALDRAVEIPIYFVLGNHDFYNGSIELVRDDIRHLVSERPRLRYLSTAGIISLTKSTALLGHDGWADARFGDFNNSRVTLNDYRLIQELRPKGLGGRLGTRPKSELIIILQRLAAEAAAHFDTLLRKAFNSFSSVIAVTHVPPFREACRYCGQESDDNFLPHYSSKIVGDVMIKVMKHYSEKQLTVLCGHTHSSSCAEILPNLKVLTGRASYGELTLQQVIEV